MVGGVWYRQGRTAHADAADRSQTCGMASERSDLARPLLAIRSSRVGRAAGVLLVGVFLVAGCSGDSGDDQQSSQNPPSTAALERAVRESRVAFDSGDGERAYEFYTDRCKKETSRSEFERTSTGWAKLIGTPPRILSVKIDKPASDALEAAVTIVLSPVKDETEDNEASEYWVVENNEWRQDDCGSDDLSPESRQPAT
jgi:hypothetical protein